MHVHFILYVCDQQRSSTFYRELLQSEPDLDVPGMTEFKLSDTAVLGLMPEQGIKRLLPRLPDPSVSAVTPRAELYLVVQDAQAYYERALSLGASILSEVSERDWGQKVGYCLDMDGHVLAFAENGLPAKEDQS